MAMATFKCEFPRRQAMLSIRERRPVSGGEQYFVQAYEDVITGHVPVFVWPMPTHDGQFIVEHKDGRCQKVQPYELTFLGSKELFDQYDWVAE